MKYEVKINKLPKSEVDLQISLPANFLDTARRKAIEMFATSLDIDGFRKGHVPESVVVSKVGETKIIEEAADIILREHFPKIIEQEKLDIIGRPKISITKLALGNPVELKAVFAVMPTFEIFDYKKIAKENIEKAKGEEKKVEATEKEIMDVLQEIRKNKAHLDWHKANPDHREHDHPDLDKEENLPPLDDELAKLAGNFKDLSELKAKIKQNIIEEKKAKNTERLRASIMEDLLKNTKIDLPDILIESETEKSLAKMKDDIERAGGNFDDYLKHIKKEEADLKKDLKESSEKKAGIQLIFNKIAEIEKIEPNKDIMEAEIKEIMRLYPDASPENARIYVSTILVNQEVLKLLEN